jgi:drug/metabolite transporter (DMT)-like permease
VTFGALGMLLVALGVALIDGVLRSQRVLDVTAWRLLFGTLALLPLNLLSPGRRQAVSRLARPGPLWRHAVPAAVLGGALAMWAWLAGFAAADLSRAAVLNQLSTVWIYLLAVLFLGEALTARGVLALSLAFGGALLVMTG